MGILNPQGLKIFLLAGMLFWAPALGHSAEVIVEPYGYEGDDLALVEQGDTFIICDCPEPPSLLPRLQIPPLALKTTAIHPVSVKPKRHNLFEPQVFTVYFDFNSTVVTEYSQEKLRKIVKKIKSLPGEKRIVLEGHTCTIGNPDYNDRLSLNRAFAVQHWLESQDIIVETAKGRGACCPVSKEHRLNRRVEIHVNPSHEKGESS